MSDKMKLERFLDRDLILGRFRDLDELKKDINDFLIDKEIDNRCLFVKDIEYKSDYTNCCDYQDYEVLLTLGTRDEDIYDVSIYYANTRNEEHVIVETWWEEL